MRQCFAIVTVLITSAYAAYSDCGPYGNCSCGHHEMDCSKTLLPLKDICDDIGRLAVNNVHVLRAEFNGIANVSDQITDGCEHLTRLYLKGNSISREGLTIFEKFDNLELLDLSANSLGQYYQNGGSLFHFQRTLNSLMLNATVDASKKCSYPDLGHLANLSSLYLDGLENASFPKSYRKLSNLRKLSLSGMTGRCHISVVFNDTFINLPYLTELDISNCSIINVYAGAFEKLIKLERLDISLNSGLGFRVSRNVTYGLQFTNIKFANFSKVYTTFGMGTYISKRDICYLWNTSLTEIAMSSNRLVMFETNALMLLPKSLKVIHIEDNRFTFTNYILQIGCMSNMVEFYGNRQNTAHNPFLFFRERDDPIPKEEPHYDECPFMKDDFLRNISQADKNCPFIERNMMFGAQSEWSHIRNETIGALSIWPQIPKTLKIAYFSNCALQYNIPALPVLSTVNSLEYLDFSYNVLSKWTGPVGPFPRLKNLDLSRNYCSYIGPLMFKYLGTLENLQIQQNFIGLVLANQNYPIFDSLTNLHTLNLSSNAISYIPPKCFYRMGKLETLDLSVNNINRWTIDVRTLYKLKRLILRYNSFGSLPRSLRTKLVQNVQGSNDSFTVDLRNNTIVCSCAHKNFLNWMVKYSENMVSFNEYNFQDDSGSEISMEKFLECVKALKKSCRSYVTLIVVGCIGISVFCAIMFGGFIYKNRWKLRYLTRMAKIRYFGYTHLDNQEQKDYLYDAFISYAEEDSQFVLDQLVPYLERQNLELCIHCRDFRAGRNIIDNIMGAIANSKKTIAIISEDFLKSTWCMYEFNMARMDGIYSRDGTNCLVVVMFTDVPAESMPNEMLAWIRANTYLEYTAVEQDEQPFWQSLYHAILD